MPLLANSEPLQTFGNQAGQFNFTGTGLEALTSTEYSLVTIAVDVTWSVNPFKDGLRDALIAAVEACKKSPRVEYLLIRVITFSTKVGVCELHGFTPLSQINPADYPEFDPDGGTNLFDASFDAVAATVQYGKGLMDIDFLTNGIVFIITDGDDNSSSRTPKSIAAEIAKAAKAETLESLHTVLIGINAAEFSDELSKFKDEAKIDQYIDAGDATSRTLAKLAEFVSSSISSTSLALGTGGPSQTISATI